MEENKIFIVETTNNGKWEMNHGYHIVKATNIDDAKIIAMSNIEGEIIQTVEINDFLDNDSIIFPASRVHVKGEIRTIIYSQEM